MPNNPLDVRLQENVGHTVDMLSPTVHNQTTEQYDQFGIWLQVEIRVRDLELMTKFYQDVLDLPKGKIDRKTVDSHQRCILHLPYGKLVLVQDDEGELPADKGIHHGISMITFITGTEDRVNALYRRLKTMDDDRVINGPYFDRFNHYLIEAVDPEGNTIAFSD